MTAKELAAFLLQHPDAKVAIAWTETVYPYSEYSPETEEYVEPMHAIYAEEGNTLVLAADCYLQRHYGPRRDIIWKDK